EAQALRRFLDLNGNPVAGSDAGVAKACRDPRRHAIDIAVRERCAVARREQLVVGMLGELAMKMREEVLIGRAHRCDESRACRARAHKAVRTRAASASSSSTGVCGKSLS